MNEKDDPLAAALLSLPAPELDEAVAARVKARARAHLAPAPVQTTAVARLRLTLAGALVPGLLASAATDHVAETVRAVDQVFGTPKKRG
jgi:hypothetical protein